VQPTNFGAFILLLIGILILIGGVYYAIQNFVVGILIGACGGLLALMMFDKLRNRLNRWIKQ